MIDPAKMRQKFNEVVERVTVEERDGTYLVSIGGVLSEVEKSELLSETYAVCRDPSHFFMTR